MRSDMFYDWQAGTAVWILAATLALGASSSAVAQQQCSGAGCEGASKRPIYHQDKEVKHGNKTYHPSFGLFPKGCRWRSVTTEGVAEISYQFWDFEANEWRDEKPAACVPTTYPPPGPEGWAFNNNTPRTEVVCQQSHCVYTNMYYNNGRWYALVDGNLYIPSWRFSRNQEVGPELPGCTLRACHGGGVVQWVGGGSWFSPSPPSPHFPPPPVRSGATCACAHACRWCPCTPLTPATSRRP